MKLGISSWLIIQRPCYRLRFFPSSFSATLWIDPHAHPYSDDFFCAYLREGDIVIDVGANIGTLTLSAAAQVGFSGHVYSFEPHPRIFGYLQRNIKLNSFSWVSSFNCAVGNENGEITLSDKNSDDQNEVGAQNGYRVVMKCLDSLDLKTAETIAMLKVDVEGYEKFVLEGGFSMLKKTQLVYCEMSEESYERHGYKCIDVLRLLIDYGFKLFRFIEKEVIIPVEIDFVPDRKINLLAVRDLNDFLNRTKFEIRLTDVSTSKSSTP